MADAHMTQRTDRSLVTRLLVVGALSVLLIINVYANVIGDHSYVAGGECGGQSCTDPGTGRGYQIAVVLVLVMLVVLAWPAIVRRFVQRLREDGESSHL